jgi:hypothetical protein
MLSLRRLLARSLWRHSQRSTRQAHIACGLLVSGFSIPTRALSQAPPTHPSAHSAWKHQMACCACGSQHTPIACKRCKNARAPATGVSGSSKLNSCNICAAPSWYAAPNEVPLKQTPSLPACTAASTACDTVLPPPSPLCCCSARASDLYFHTTRMLHDNLFLAIAAVAQNDVGVPRGNCHRWQ